MIPLEFIPPKGDTTWTTWLESCARKQKEHNRLCESGEPQKVSPLYSHTKSVFLAAFRGKCAYCESEIAAAQHGSLDHYRPKQGVTENGQVVLSADGSRRHRGYYWLAYDWNNLLPSCILCNEPSTKLSGGKLVGKRNEFPIRGKRAWKPGEEQEEMPLLLNPCRVVDLSKHLRFEENGSITPISEEGRVTVEIFGLNIREALVKARAQAYKQGKDAAWHFGLAFFQKSEEEKKRQRDVIESFRNGSRPYSGAGLAGVEAGFSAIDAEQEAFKAERNRKSSDNRQGLSFEAQLSPSK